MTIESRASTSSETPEAETRARELVQLATDFNTTGTKQAAEAFARDWQAIVAAGPNYRDQVELAAEKVTRDSLTPDMPAVIIERYGPNPYIRFSSTPLGLLVPGSKGGEIYAGEDGSVRALIPRQNGALEPPEEDYQ